MSGRLEVVVTGMGAVSALGHDCASLLSAVERGVGGIGPVQRFDTRAFRVHTAAEVRCWPAQPPTDTAPFEEWLCREFALRAAREALEQARLDLGAVPPERVGFVFGTGLGDVERPIHELTEELAEGLGIRGPRLTVCTACSSSTGAIGLARHLLVRGWADAILAGGADVLTPRVFAGFHALGVLNPEKCAPFSTPFGTTLGEGAGFLVMESAVGAGSRGVETLARVSGYGLSGDGYHETSPEPGGRGVGRAVRWALADAGIRANEVGYVNAHGSGTEANDPSEWRGIQRGLEGSAAVPVSSTKGALGHTQGAAGALETIVTILGMRRGLLPPTLNFVGPRPFAPEDPVVGPAPRAGSYDHALCINAAFGGANAAIIVSRKPQVRVESREKAPVGVLGVGMVGRHGLDVSAWEAREGKAESGRVPPFRFSDINPRIDDHGLDPSSRFLTAAVALALKEAGNGPAVRGRDDVGLILGSIRPSPESLAAFARSIDDMGLERVSPPAFARIVLNAPAGFCSKLLGLRGPMTTLTLGAGSGLAAIIVAAELVSSVEDVSLMLGAAVDEFGEEDQSGCMPAGEGAVCAAVGRLKGATSSTEAPRITSWGVAGPRCLSDAVEQAMNGAPTESHEVDAVFDEAHHAGSGTQHWALPSALAFATAVSALRRGEIRRALVTSDRGSSSSLAILLDA